MKKTTTLLFLIISTLFMHGFAQAAPVAVNLSSWVSDGNGNWTVAPDNSSVFQSLNSAPTVFHNNTNSQGTALRGSITVETASDNDFIGFVLGYNQGDIDGNPGTTDYIIIDWKQGTQGGWDEGLSISRVTGAIQAGGTDTTADAWDHVGNVQFLSRATNLGDTGWEDNTTYSFAIEFTATVIRVFVNDVLEIEEFGTFGDGAFGFYNFSQPNVRYAGITEEVIPDASDVPLPAAFWFMGAGLAAYARSRKQKAVG